MANACSGRAGTRARARRMRKSLALRAAGAQVRGATVYVSLEPCSHTGRTPPCADALIAAGAARVVCCTPDPNPRVAGRGIERLQRAGIAVQVGEFAEEARRLNVGYFSRHERGRPYVRLKLAMSLDGRTAPADGSRAWLSGTASRADVQTWRARSSAVLTGAATVRSDDPQLNVRLNYGPWVRQPLARCARYHADLGADGPGLQTRRGAHFRGARGCAGAVQRPRRRTNCAQRGRPRP